MDGALDRRSFADQLLSGSNSGNGIGAPYLYDILTARSVFAGIVEPAAMSQRLA